MIVKAKNSGGLTIFLTVVYGSNWFNERIALWSNLIYIKEQYISGPWAVLEDFNSARCLDKKIRDG